MIAREDDEDWHRARCCFELLCFNAHIELSVVVVNWNGLASLRRALPSIEASIEAVGAQCELIVVDNGSTDGSVQYLRQQHPNVALIVNASNRGFSPAVNQGIRHSSGTFIALVNNDVVVERNWLNDLLVAIRRDDRIGSAGAQLRYLHDPGRINSAGIVVDLVGRPQDRLDGLPAAREQATADVFGVSAGAAVYRRSMLEDVGLLDERFFAYLEDVDLAWRARRRGWRAVHVPTAVVLHAYSATSEQVRGLKTYLSARNHIWMLTRNASPTQLVISAPALLVLWVWTLAIDLSKRELSGVRGIAAGLRGIGAARRERHGPYLPLTDFAIPRPLRYRFAARARREQARATVEPQIADLAAVPSSHDSE